MISGKTRVASAWIYGREKRRRGCYLDVLAFLLDFAPRNGFLGAGACVAAVELLTGIDVHGEVGAVSHQIRIADVMLYDAAAEDDDAGLPLEHGLVVDGFDIANDIDDKAWVFVGVEVEHVAQGPIRQCWAIDWDVILS